MSKDELVEVLISMTQMVGTLHRAMAEKAIDDAAEEYVEELFEEFYVNMQLLLVGNSEYSN